MMNPTVPIMGYRVYGGNLQDINFEKKPLVISTINAHSYMLAEEDRVFRQALVESDVLLADGFPIVIAARLSGGYKIKKIAGADIFYFLLDRLNKSSGSCFFLGSTPETLAKIRSRISVEFPDISADSYSPPFKVSYSEQENKEMLDAINSFRPEVLFIGMTAPKQEKWAQANISQIKSGIICSVGAVFDFYAQTTKRPAKIWINLGLEWFIRFVKEPRRLWKRYFISSPKFFKHMLIDILKSKTIH